MKWGPFRFKRDWQGKRVRTLRELETRGGDVYPAGAVGTVGGVLGAGWFDIRFDPCPHCGHKGTVRVPSSDWRWTFELVDEVDR